MTDFLSRVAARAVGASAAAQPRLAGLFEPTAVGDATLEVVEEEIVAPPGSGPKREAAPSAADPGGAPAPALDGGTPVRPQRADSPGARLEPRPPERTDSVAESNDVPAPIASPERQPEPTSAPDPVPVRRQGREPSVVAAAPLAQALPAAPATTPSNSLLLGSAAAPRDEPPPVRVHIGRLEVRANIQSPPSERPPREPAHPEGLSLADYLRGRREVRS